MNGGDLRFGRVEDRLNLRLLVSRQVQLASELLKAERVDRARTRTPGPAWAWVMIKPPSAIAPAATTANRFLFIVGFVCCLEALLRAFKRNDRVQPAAVTKFLWHVCSRAQPASRQVLGTSTSTREVVTKAQSRRSCLMVWMRS